MFDELPQSSIHVDQRFRATIATSMYDVNDYGRMMADPVRMQAYTEALRRAVKPGSVVVDVGTGTGVFALLAAKFGARKVYAIDTNPCIDLAREMAARNGFGERIEFIRKDLFDVELPERADVLVCDCRGAFTLFRRHPEIAFSVRDRWLKAGGVMLPQLDELLVTLVEGTEVYESVRGAWRVADLDWTPCIEAALSSVIDERTLPGSVLEPLTPRLAWGRVDFRASTETVVHGRAQGTVTRPGTIHFLALSFRTEVAHGIGYASDDLEHTHTRLLLPLRDPLEVAAGDAVAVRIDAFPTRDDYIFAWHLSARGEERKQVTDGNPKRSLALEFSAGSRHPTAQR